MSRGKLIKSLLAIWLMFGGLTVATHGTAIPIFPYYCHNSNNECQVLDPPCDYDYITWSNLIVDIRPGFIPEEYNVIGGNQFHPNQLVKIIVAPDGTYEVNLEFNQDQYWTAYGGNLEIPFTWGIEGPPGIEVAVDADTTVMQPPTCEGSSVSRIGTVRVTIGAAELPPDEDQTKECDPSTDCETCPKGPMATYFIHLMLASLHIEDTPISYNPPYGPSTAFKVSYNQREANQPASVDYSNFGPKWTFNWLSYVTDFPNFPTADASVYVRGGGREPYHSFDSGSQSYAPHPQSLAVLARTGEFTYEKRFPDGSKEIFGPDSDGATHPRRVFLTSVVDPAGNAVILEYYPTTLRLRFITDSIGRATRLDYEESDPFKVSKVTDPFGRFARFEYTADGKLNKITDSILIASEFFYEAGTDFINRMRTPYGDTTFVKGEDGNHQRWLEATDPRGGKERVEFNDAVDGIAPFETVIPNPGPYPVYNAGLNRANTFYWDKKAMADAPGDYTKARVTHWLTSADGSKLSGIKHSEKQPLERRVWYTYEGQTGDDGKVGTSGLPIRVAQQAGGGRVSQFEYNTLGNVTKSIDPVDRETHYIYDPSNNVDLLEIRQISPTGPLLRKFTYNSQHKPLTDTDAAGQPTTYTYNEFGQVLTRRNAKLETTTFAYGGTAPDGYLESITSPPFNVANARTIFGYDDFNRVETVTNEADDYMVTTDYDAINRKTRVTYPDTTFEEFQYTHDFGQGSTMILDLTGSRDRLGRWTYREYNRNRQLQMITDPADRKTKYNWCACGSLTSITDPKDQTTTFHRDVQGRVHQKVFADNTTIDYLYEGQGAPNAVGTSSRLRSSTDALNRVTDYRYFRDDNISEVNYLNLSGDPLMPGVNYTYDPDYNRVATMNLGSGLTEYHYYPIDPSPALGAGKLQSVDGPLTNDTITFTYDELGRTLGQSINGVAQTVTYDSLGRLNTTSNPLGLFNHAYDGVTPRLLNVNYPNGQTANYTYFEDNADDRRLRTLQNLAGGAVNLSRFDYTYDDEGQIMSLSRVLGTTASGRWFAYDEARQLLSARDEFHPNQATQVNGYGYDAAGNRTGDSNFNPQVQGPFPNGTFHAYTLNNVNQIESFTRQSGPSSFELTLTYDLAGNLTDNGEGKTFDWDAANRLSAINYLASGARTEFAYDGLGRRVKITEYGPGVTATIQPKGTEYTAFTTTPFTLPSGSYTVTFEGLNHNGDNVALIDFVTLNSTLVTNGSFESPDVSASPGGYEVNPAGATWTFTGAAGIAANGSDFTSKNPDAPDGQQVAFIQNDGNASLTWTASAGTHTLGFQAAQGGSNGSDQQLRVTLRPSTAAVTVKTFVWCGNQICEERDSGGATVTKRFFGEGEQRVGGSDAGNYYYTRDHLGSIREVTAANGSLVARYDYDPYGNSVVVDGNMNVDFGYTGHYFHAPSGLNLTLFRAYNPALGRWLSRDPIGEQGGLNLHGYVRNQPTSLVDLFGLNPDDPYGFNEAETLGTMGGQRGIDIANQAPRIVSDTVRDGLIDVGIGGLPTSVVLGAVFRVGANLVRMTQWGWTGSRAWLRMVRILERGGTLEDLGEKIPTLEEAEEMLQRARCTINRVETGHAPPNPHSYRHINYTTPTGGKGTVRIQ